MRIMSLEDMTVEELERILTGVFALEYTVDIVTDDVVTYYNSLRLLNSDQVRPTEAEIRPHLPEIRARLREERADRVLINRYTTGKMAVLLGRALNGDAEATNEVQQMITLYGETP